MFKSFLPTVCLICLCSFGMATEAGESPSILFGSSLNVTVDQALWLALKRELTGEDTFEKSYREKWSDAINRRMALEEPRVLIYRLTRLDWADEEREEIAACFLDTARRMLEKPDYLDENDFDRYLGSIHQDNYYKDAPNGQFLKMLLWTHVQFAQTLHTEELTHIWKLAQGPEEYKKHIRTFLADIVRSRYESPEIPDLVKKWLSSNDDESGWYENSCLNDALDAHIRTVFDNAYEKPWHSPNLPWKLIIRPLDSHTTYTNGVPVYPFGTEKISIQVTLKNDGTAPRTFLPHLFESRGHTEHFYKIVADHDMDAAKIDWDFPEWSRHYRRAGAPWLPNERTPVVTLAPGEEYIFVHELPITWVLPRHGKWGKEAADIPSVVTRDHLPHNCTIYVPRHCIGGKPEGTVWLNQRIPAGWANFLSKNGYAKDGESYFEGEITGSMQFIVTQPTETKAELLRQVREIIRKASSDFFWRDDVMLVFLKCYLVAPQEMQALLMKNRHTLNIDRRCIVYTGLEMFDTPEAMAAVEAMPRSKHVDVFNIILQYGIAIGVFTALIVAILYTRRLRRRRLRPI